MVCKLQWPLVAGGERQRLLNAKVRLKVEPTQDPQLRDPLSEVTRKERLYLLAISTIGITIEYTGLIPSEITTFGIRFGEADQNYLLIILALVITYFLVAFTLYAASDFLAWRLTFQTMIRESSQKQIREQAERGQSADQRAREEERERKRPSMAPKNRDGVSAQPCRIGTLGFKSKRMILRRSSGIDIEPFFSSQPPSPF